MRNIVLIFVINFLLSSCSIKKEFTFDQVKTLKPSHTAINNSIFKIIDDIIYERNLISLNENEYIQIYFIEDKKNTSYTEIQVSTADFEIEKMYHQFNQSEKTNRQVGYLTYKDIFITIDGNSNFYFKELNKPKDIFSNKKTSNFIIPIYEPPVFEYRLFDNGHVKFISEL